MQSGTGVVTRRKSGGVYWLIGVVTVALAVAAVMGIWIAVAPTPYEVASPTQSITSVAPSTVAPATSSAVPQPPSLPHDFVAQALPTNLTVTSNGGEVLIDQPVVRAARVPVGPGQFNLNPPGDTVAMFDDPLVPWAVQPGSDAATVVVVCHSNANPAMACNPLGVVNPSSNANGYQAVMKLPGGELTYNLVGIHPVPKDQQFAQWKSMSDVPGRLLISMCALDSSSGRLLNTDTTAVWEFQLLSSKANP